MLTSYNRKKKERKKEKGKKQSYYGDGPRVYRRCIRRQRKRSKRSHPSSPDQARGSEKWVRQRRGRGSFRVWKIEFEGEGKVEASLSLHGERGEWIGGSLEMGSGSETEAPPPSAVSSPVTSCLVYCRIVVCQMLAGIRHWLRTISVFS